MEAGSSGWDGGRCTSALQPEGRERSKPWIHRLTRGRAVSRPRRGITKMGKPVAWEVMLASWFSKRPSSRPGLRSDVGSA